MCAGIWLQSLYLSLHGLTDEELLIHKKVLSLLGSSTKWQNGDYQSGKCKKQARERQDGTRELIAQECCTGKLPAQTAASTGGERNGSK